MCIRSRDEADQSRGLDNYTEKKSLYSGLLHSHYLVTKEINARIRYVWAPPFVPPANLTKSTNEKGFGQVEDLYKLLKSSGAGTGNVVIIMIQRNTLPLSLCRSLQVAPIDLRPGLLHRATPVVVWLERTKRRNREARNNPLTISHTCCTLFCYSLPASSL